MFESLTIAVCVSIAITLPSWQGVQLEGCGSMAGGVAGHFRAPPGVNFLATGGVCVLVMLSHQHTFWRRFTDASQVCLSLRGEWEHLWQWQPCGQLPCSRLR
jgi:hypothetical protein